MRFSKDDHVIFVPLYDLVVMRGLEFRIVKAFSKILTNLLHPFCHNFINISTCSLSKTTRLSRLDLCLPWQPLYELYEMFTDENLW